MAVEVKYVVIREGEEKMSFTSKKEADAYDKMLDTADLLDTWLEQSPVALEDEQREALSLWLAKRCAERHSEKWQAAFAAGCRKRCARWG